MLYVCVRDVMDVVFYVCIVTRGFVGARVWEVLMFCHVVCLCASSGRSQCCILHDLVDDARGILQSRSHDGLIGSYECLLLFTPSCCCACFYHL